MSNTIRTHKRGRITSIIVTMDTHTSNDSFFNYIKTTIVSLQLHAFIYSYTRSFYLISHTQFHQSVPLRTFLFFFLIDYINIKSRISAVVTLNFQFSLEFNQVFLDPPLTRIRESIHRFLYARLNRWRKKKTFTILPREPPLPFDIQRSCTN